METFIYEDAAAEGRPQSSSLSRSAWKALTYGQHELNIIRYLYKTVRKYFGEAIVVTQEVDDIISSARSSRRRSSTTPTARSFWTSASTSSKFDGDSVVCWG